MSSSSNTSSRSDSSPEWATIAQDMLGLWQDHLTALATDPQARADMARLMTQSFAPWSTLYDGWQKAANAATPPTNSASGGNTPNWGFKPWDTPSEQAPPEQAPSEKSVGSSIAPERSVDDTSAARTDDVAGLAERVARLEERLTTLESALYAAITATASTGHATKEQPSGACSTDNPAPAPRRTKSSRARSRAG